VCHRLGELADEIGGRLVPVLAAAAAALAAGAGADTRTAGALAEAATTLDRLGYTLHAAELMMAAARAYRRLGHRSRALVCREAALELAGRCEGAGTVLLAFGDGDAPLTTREREILMLATSHSSKEIAVRLGVAVSTVNNHLASAYAKLGITGRKELADLLRVSPGRS
jgi:DNA-binding CsgD family transcriptional regulator